MFATPTSSSNLMEVMASALSAFWWKGTRDSRVDARRTTATESSKTQRFDGPRPLRLAQSRIAVKQQTSRTAHRCQVDAIDEGHLGCRNTCVSVRVWLELWACMADAQLGEAAARAALKREPSGGMSRLANTVPHVSYLRRAMVGI